VSIILEKYVAYYRVSTKRQGKSGLGLEAQQKAVHEMAARNGATILAEYIEVETGKSSKRPKLHEAIRHARLTNSTLVVAKLDRLARNAYFTRTLKESKQKFTCCDNEKANDLTIDLLAVVAEHEARAIATRTREALAIAKDRGTLLGSNRPGHWDGREDRRQAGTTNGLSLAVAEYSRIARDHYADVIVPKMKEWREQGRSLDEIAALLNADGFTTRRDQKPFTKATVWRLLDRYLGGEFLGHGRQPACASAREAS
jgi:DNA invertase Pin-like site-specific DNA recombinase